MKNKATLLYIHIKTTVDTIPPLRWLVQLLSQLSHHTASVHPDYTLWRDCGEKSVSLLVSHVGSGGAYCEYCGGGVRLDGVTCG